MKLLSKFNQLRTKSNGQQMTSASIVSAGCVCMNKLLDQQLKIKDLRPLYIALSKLKPEHKNKIGSSLVQELLNHDSTMINLKSLINRAFFTSVSSFFMFTNTGTITVNTLVPQSIMQTYLRTFTNFASRFSNVVFTF
jgi:hypothetical protein